MKRGFIFGVIFGVNSALASPVGVLISEIAWMGTQASSYDEWIELRNNSVNSVNITGWTLTTADGTPNITLNGSLPPQGFWLLERTDDTTTSAPANQIYTGSLSNEGESLVLKNKSGEIIDQSPTGWIAGNKDLKQTMERFDLTTWRTYSDDGDPTTDAAENQIQGTPKAKNSAENFSLIALSPNAKIHFQGKNKVTSTQKVNVTGSASSDPNNDGEIISYSWQLRLYQGDKKIWRKNFSDKENPSYLELKKHQNFSESECLTHSYEIILVVTNQYNEIDQEGVKIPLRWDEDNCTAQAIEQEDIEPVSAVSEPKKSADFFAEFLATSKNHQFFIDQEAGMDTPERRFYLFARDQFFEDTGLSPERIQKNLGLILVDNFNL